MSGNEVGMAVSLNHELNDKPMRLCVVQIDTDVALRVDNRGFPARSDQIRSVGQTAQIILPEIHEEDFSKPGIVNTHGRCEGIRLNSSPFGRDRRRLLKNWYRAAVGAVYDRALFLEST